MESSDDGAVSKTAEDNVPSESQTSSPSNSCSNGESITFEHLALYPLVVDKIVEHLDPSFERLKTLRLVCKMWTEATLHHWRKSCAVLTLIPEHPSFFTEPKHSKGLTVYQFFTEFQDPKSPFQFSEQPFSKYKFKGLTFDIRKCNKTGGPAQGFWNAIGPLIESLYFENCIFLKPAPWDKSVMTVTFPLTQLLIGFMPNVKHLVLNDVKTDELKWYVRGQVEDFQVFAAKPDLNLRTLTFYGDTEPKDIDLQDLLKMTPKLESIKGMDSSKMDLTVEALLKPIHEVRLNLKSDGDPVPLSNLKHLDLINCRSSYFLSNDYIWRFLFRSSRQLPLESLAINFGTISAGDMRMYLKSFSGTLKTLKLVRLPTFPVSSNCLGGAPHEMSLLKELILWGTVFLDFEFLKNTPNLNKLMVDLECFGKRDLWSSQKYKEDWVLKVPKDLRDGILCSELAHLKIDFEFPEESLRLLGKWMPNLKRLGMILNVTTVPVVCEVWRELTELVCLHGSKIDNSCFIRDQEQAGFSGSSPAKLKLCDLKELERFQLDTCCGESKLTDDVVFNGFLKMSGLKRVQICVNSQVTAEAEEALRRAIPFCKVIRNIPVTMVGSGYGGASGSGNCGCDRCKLRAEGSGVSRIYPSIEIVEMVATLG